MQALRGMDFSGSACYCEHMDKGLFGERLRRLREARGLSQRALARLVGKSSPWITQLETGQRWRDKLPPHDDLRDLAGVLGITVDELVGTAGPTNDGHEPDQALTPRRDETQELAEFGREVLRMAQRRIRSNIVRVDPTQVTSARVPVINAVAASELMRHERQVEETIMVLAGAIEGASEPVAFVIVGDCLRDEGIVTGDYLLVDAANKDPRDGEIVAARVNGEETAKCFYRVGDTVELRAASAGYKPIVVTERDELEIIGVYVGHIHIGKRARR